MLLERHFVLAGFVFLAGIFGATLVTSAQAASAQVSKSGGEDKLVEISYRFEVAGYCGLVNEEVARGYHLERKRLLSQHELSEAEQQTARGDAWQAAHKEWMNRGLGGFKRWCRNEGREYVDSFLLLSQLEGGR